jgi:hypothetical protein
METAVKVDHRLFLSLDGYLLSASAIEHICHAIARHVGLLVHAPSLQRATTAGDGDARQSLYSGFHCISAYFEAHFA